MLQVRSLGALAWYVRGACRTGKKAEWTSARASELSLGLCHPPLGNKSQLSKGLPPNVAHGMNALYPH